MKEIVTGTSSVEIQSALNEFGHVRFKRGVHVLSSPLILDGDKRIDGEPGAFIHCESDFVKVSGARNSISDLQVYHREPGKVLGVAVEFTGFVTRFHMDRVNVFRFEEGMTDRNATGHSSMWYVSDCNFYYSPIYLENSHGMCFWSRCAFVATGSYPGGGHIDRPFVHISDNSGMTFDHCHVQGNGDVSNPNWVVGFRFRNSVVTLDHCTAENVPGYGLAAVGCTALRLNQVNLGLNTKVGLWMDNCKRVSMNGLCVRGRNVTGIESIPNTPNIRISEGNNYTMSDLISIDSLAGDIISPSVPYS